MMYKTLIVFVVAAGVLALKPAPPQTALSAQIARGKLLYQQQCLTCHQIDGGGVMNMNPPLAQTTYVLGPKAALIRIVM